MYFSITSDVVRYQLVMMHVFFRLPKSEKRFGSREVEMSCTIYLKGYFESVYRICRQEMPW